MELMRYAVKNKGNMVQAYELGAGGEMEQCLIEEGAIRRETDGSYRLFSKETVNGTGQIAYAGDFFKVDIEDGRCYPYPNSCEWFLKHHIPRGDNMYEQCVSPMPIWTKDDPPCDIVNDLVASGQLKIDPASKDHYFNAELWGAPLSAGEDAVLVFHRVERNEDGTIKNIGFNFVERQIFDRDYTIFNPIQ